MSKKNSLDFIRSLPKAELHIHLTGAYPLSYLKKIARDPISQNEYNNLVVGLAKIAQGVDYHKVFEYFFHAEKIVNTYDKVENGVVALGEELANDGIVYAEIRTGLKDLGNGYEEYLLAVLRGIARCQKKIKLRLLLSLRRNTLPSLAKLTIDLAIRYKDQGVVGIDVSGDSTLGKVSDIASEIYRAKEESLYLSLHIGESLKEIDSPEKEKEQACALAELEPDRIGHGVFLSPQSIEWLLKRPNIPIEVCLSSSLLTGMIGHNSQHPGITYYLKHKHPIVACTDDPLLFQSSMSEELQNLISLENINQEHILQIVGYSFDLSFLPPKEKLELRNSLTTVMQDC